jgi:hypothetical protein
MSLRLPVRVLVVIVTIVVGATVAHAEFCFYSGPFTPPSTENETVVLPKRYSKPTKGTCRPLLGVEALNLPVRLVTGTVCLNSAGNTLLVSYRVHLDDAGIFTRYPLDVSMTLPYPSMQNGTSTTLRSGTADPEFAHASVHAGGGTCPTFPIP